MHYTPLSNEKKINLDMPDVAYPYLPNSQMVQINRTHTILLFLTSIQFIVTCLISIIFGFAYIFGYSLGIETYHPIIRFLPALASACFSIGIITTDRYHAKGLLFFAKMVMLDLIITFLILSICVIIPICIQKYRVSIFSTIVIAITFEITMCLISFLPAYTIRMATHLSKLITENQFSSLK